MSALAELYADFHHALLTQDAAAVLPRLRDTGRLSPAAQMRIYSEGYRLRLISALRSDYPELLALLGEARFDALALAYVEAVPPSGASLDVYPFGFADFITRREGCGFTAELAALESAIAQVFLLPDSCALAPEELSALSPEAFGASALRLRTASALLRFTYPVEAYLTARRSGESPAMPEAQDHFLLIVRHGNAVRRHTLHPVAHVLLAALQEGLCVADALTHAAASRPDAPALLSGRLQPWFAAWTAEGFFQSRQE